MLFTAHLLAGLVAGESDVADDDVEETVSTAVPIAARPVPSTPNSGQDKTNKTTLSSAQRYQSQQYK